MQMAYNHRQTMPLLQIFRKDKKYWSHDEIEEVELFFMLNTFYNKFYEHQDFDKVVNFTFYAKLQPQEESKLELNKKSEMLILLSGEIEIYRKSYDKEIKKKLKNKEKDVIYDCYIKMGEYYSSYEMIELRNDCIVRAKEGSTVEFLFVPTILYEAHSTNVNTRRTDKIMEVLMKFFSEASKRDLKALAQIGCSFKEFKMNNFIYRIGSVPEYCCILLEGNIKLESSGFSAKKMMQMVIISPNTFFGDKDLNDDQRNQNAICCSSHCKMMIIAKEAYNKFIGRNPQINPAYAEKLKEQSNFKSRKESKSTLDNYDDKHTLPRIYRFHSYMKPEEQQKIEKQLANNCHILINLSPKRRVKSSFRFPEKSQRDYSVSQFQQKMKLFKRMKITDTEFDPNNKLF